MEELNSVYPNGTQALKNINLRIQENEFIGIIGQNGAGKSTLLKHMTGLLKPASGKVMILGSDTEQTKVSQISAHVGLVLQNPDLQLFAQTVREELEFGLKNMNIKGQEMKRRVQKALSLTGMEDKKEAFPPALSRGDRARVVLASVLAMEPEIIILDEPTRGQDYRGCRQIMNIVKTLHSSGKTIIMVSHDMPLIAKYSKRILVLKKGELLMEGPPKKVFSHPDILLKTHIKPPHITRLGFSLQEELQHKEPIFEETEMGELILRAIKNKTGGSL